MLQDALDGGLNCSFIFSAYESLLKCDEGRFVMQLLPSRQVQDFALYQIAMNAELSSLNKKKFILILDFDTTVRTTGVRL